MRVVNQGNNKEGMKYTPKKKESSKITISREEIKELYARMGYIMIANAVEDIVRYSSWKRGELHYQDKTKEDVLPGAYQLAVNWLLDTDDSYVFSFQRIRQQTGLAYTGEEIVGHAERMSCEELKELKGLATLDKEETQTLREMLTNGCSIRSMTKTIQRKFGKKRSWAIIKKHVERIKEGRE